MPGFVCACFGFAGGPATINSIVMRFAKRANAKQKSLLHDKGRSTDVLSSHSECAFQSSLLYLPLQGPGV